MIALACWALGVATGGAATAWGMSAVAVLRRTGSAEGGSRGPY